MSRCVNCMWPKEAHPHPLMLCPGMKQTCFASTELPDGKTCDECAHFKRCSGLIGSVTGNTSCDWYPIRFRVLPKAAL
jgi:hypothetical protein